MVFHCLRTHRDGFPTGPCPGRDRIPVDVFPRRIPNAVRTGSHLFPFLIALIAAQLTAPPALAGPDGETLPLIRDMPLTRVWRAEKDIVIPTAERPAAHTIELPAVSPRDGGILCLRFQARLHTPVPGGWNHYLGIRINGEPLDRYTHLGTERLLKRSKFVRTTITSPRSWWSRRGGIPVLFVPFGPPDRLDPRILSDRAEGYWYLLDVSDVAHYRRTGADGRVEFDAPNRIEFINTCVRRYFPNRKQDFPDMVLSDLELGWIPPRFANRLRALHLDRYPPIASGPEIAAGDWSFRIGPNGGMQLDIAGDRYFFASFVSYPAEPQQEFNSLTPNCAAGADNWKPTVAPTADGGIRIDAECREYRFHRVVRQDNGVLRFRDTIVNLTDEPIGVIIRNCLTLPAPPRPHSYRLAGTDREILVGGCAANPTVFTAQESSSLGVVAEDNVFRLQLELVHRANTFEFRTTHFGLDARRAYTIEWSAYPGRSRDYFDFVNRVRRDWNVNYTIDGPFAFDSKVIPGRKVKIYVFGPWLDYHHDGSQTRDKYRRTVEPILARLKSAAPDGIFMPKIETNLFTIVRSRIPGGEKLPGSSRTSGRYGHVLAPEQSRILEQGIGPWKDSILYAPELRVIVDTYYEGYHPNGRDLLNLLLYLREGNQRCRLFLDQIEFCMDRIGFNGIYIDQFSQEGDLTQKDRYTFDSWDGHTVDTARNGRITRMYTDCNLAGAKARASILDAIFKRGGKVVINGQSTVRETRSFPAWRFQEMENDSIDPLNFLHEKPPIFYWQARGHLGCPLILGIRPVRYGEEGKKHRAEMITKAVITALRNGVLYYYYTSTIPKSGPGAGGYGPVNHMFPFTPVELHEGWLVGRERTITCVSRPIRRKQRPNVFRFDLRGLPKPADFPIRRTPSGWTVDVRIDDWNEIVVVEDARRKQ